MPQFGGNALPPEGGAGHGMVVPLSGSGAGRKTFAARTRNTLKIVYDFVEYEGLCLLVMEKLTGGTVWDRFQSSGMTIENACAVALAILLPFALPYPPTSALASAASGVLR